MLRGIHITRPAVSGGITFFLFTMRAVEIYVWSGTEQWAKDLVYFFNNPVVVFVMFLFAGLVITYPWFKGWRTFIIAPLMIILIIFFVYTYYIL
jgi:membrane-bound ClpP family serine protease